MHPPRSLVANVEREIQPKYSLTTPIVSGSSDRRMSDGSAVATTLGWLSSCLAAATDRVAAWPCNVSALSASAM